MRVIGECITLRQVSSPEQFLAKKFIASSYFNTARPAFILYTEKNIVTDSLLQEQGKTLKKLMTYPGSFVVVVVGGFFVWFCLVFLCFVGGFFGIGCFFFLLFLFACFQFSEHSEGDSKDPMNQLCGQARYLHQYLCSFFQIKIRSSSKIYSLQVSNCAPLAVAILKIDRAECLLQGNLAARSCASFVSNRLIYVSQND